MREGRKHTGSGATTRHAGNPKRQGPGRIRRDFDGEPRGLSFKFGEVPAEVYI